MFIRPFPDVDGGKWPVSSGGGRAPVWAHSGRELFYWAGGNMNVVEIHPGPPFTVGQPQVLFAQPERVRGVTAIRGTFAIAPDDRRFLMIRDVPLGDTTGTARPQLVIVENFFKELREKTGK